MTAQPSLVNQQFDTIVIGTGLAGLTAALRLQLQGQRVLVIDRRSVAGGLCGTMAFDGYEFTLACNDFGRRTPQEMAALGVQIGFRSLASRFVNESGYIQSPPDLRTALGLLRRAPGLLRLLSRLRRASGQEYLGELLERHRVETALRDLLGIAAYGLGTPLSALPVETLLSLFSKEWNYGYEKATTPVGGPGVLVAAMVQRFEQLGGTLLLGTHCERVEGTAPQRRVVTPGSDYIARFVISSEGRWAEYPPASRQGLAASMLLLGVACPFKFPAGFHTLGYFPSGFAEWMEQISRGERPARFGFHLFRNDWADRPEHHTVNILFYLPCGWDDPDEVQVRWAEGFILEHAERLLPGLGRAVLYKRFLSPRAFAEKSGLSPLVVPKLQPAGFAKPGGHDPVRDLYFVGNSVYPPGEHSAGAVLSGAFAADAVLKAAGIHR